MKIKEQIIINANEGMYLTNGETYGKTVILPKDADAYSWYEISEDEYSKINTGGDEGEFYDHNYPC